MAFDALVQSKNVEALLPPAKQEKDGRDEILDVA